MDHPLDFLLPVEGQQFDCTLVLLIPAKHKAEHLEEEGTAKADGQQAESAVEGGELDSEQQEEQEMRRVRLPTCSAQLACYSEKFRDWLARWSGANVEKELEVQCRSEGEVAGYRHLLAFIHSMGKEVPQGADDLIQLLLLAREHAVEPSVLACLQNLQGQVPTLPATACLALLSALETGVSGRSNIQAAADNLEIGVYENISKLLAGGAVPDAASRQMLVQYAGPLQDMLNIERRREVFASIPFDMLRDCVFADENVNADTEATVLAAFAFWAQRNIKETDADARQRIAAICSLIRFPDIPASVLLSYHKCHSFMRTFDPDKELLFMAAAWRKELVAGDNGGDLKANCVRWWLPRPQPLPSYSELEPASFDFKPVSKPDNEDFVYTQYRYWAGHYWRVKSEKREGKLGLFACPCMCHDGSGSVQKDGKLPGVQVKYTIWLCPSSATPDLEAVNLKYYFQPCTGIDWGLYEIKEAPEHDGQPITWDGFWAEGSRFMHNGAARVRLDLSLAN